MDLEKRDYYIRLYETYQNILTQNQKEYFESYYYDDLSLQEIADNKGISRNAIYDQIKKTINNLVYYEENLHLLELKDLLQKGEDQIGEQLKEKIEKFIF